MPSLWVYGGPAGLWGFRQLHGVWPGALSMRGMWEDSSREPPSVWAVVRSAVQARRPGQASIPAACARGESGRALMRPRPSAMSSAEWRSRRGVEQVLVQDADDPQTLTLDDDGAADVELPDPETPETEDALPVPGRRQ